MKIHLRPDLFEILTLKQIRVVAKMTCMLKDSLSYYNKLLWFKIRLVIKLLNFYSSFPLRRIYTVKKIYVSILLFNTHRKRSLGCIQKTNCPSVRTSVCAKSFWWIIGSSYFTQTLLMTLYTMIFTQGHVQGHSLKKCLIPVWALSCDKKKWLEAKIWQKDCLWPVNMSWLGLWSFVLIQCRRKKKKASLIY